MGQWEGPIMSGRRIGGQFGMFVGDIRSSDRFWLQLALVSRELDGSLESRVYVHVCCRVVLKLIRISLFCLVVMMMDRSRSNHLGRKRGRVQKSGHAGAK